jgi:hypothetical protein
MKKGHSIQQLTTVLELLSANEIAQIISEHGSQTLQNEFFEKYEEKLPKNTEALNASIGAMRQRFNRLCRDEDVLYSPDDFESQLIEILDGLLFI